MINKKLYFASLTIILINFKYGPVERYKYCFHSQYRFSFSTHQSSIGLLDKFEKSSIKKCYFLSLADTDR